MARGRLTLPLTLSPTLTLALTRTRTRTRPDPEPEPEPDQNPNPNPNQEARSIYRKGPDGLRACARAALVGGPSSYVLRGDYGWRERFGARAGAAEI